VLGIEKTTDPGQQAGINRSKGWGKDSLLSCFFQWIILVGDGYSEERA
jgi:hypothetical protein